MKKLLVIFTLLLFLPSITGASYTQTAADVSPGVFADGDYFFPTSTHIGLTDPPSSSSTYALYVSTEDQDYDYGIESYSYNDAIAILGRAEESVGVYGYSTNHTGVYGISRSEETEYAGVKGTATMGAPGVYGYSSSTAPGVYGYNSETSGIGVKAVATTYGFYTADATYGLYIPSADSYGVYVASSDGTGGRFTGDTYGVRATSDSIAGYFSGDSIGVFAYSEGSGNTHCAVQGYQSSSDQFGYLGCEDYALYADGDAKVDESLRVGSCSGCDIAEHFIGDDLEPGDVVVLDPTSANHVRKTTTPYDKLAAGIISTEPTITMGLSEGVPVALSGVVPTKVIGTVHLGDLLTTSSTPGYAMACTDYNKCTGAIIGKAMEENSEGEGVITALVMLG